MATSGSAASPLRLALVLGRPKFLPYSVLMHGVGVAAAYSRTGTVDLALFVIAQSFVSILHLATHYSNEYYDLYADRLNATFTRWTGGSRVLVRGGLTPRTALLIALALTGTFAAVFLFLLLERPPVVQSVPVELAWLALVTVLLLWEYSAAPLRLSRRGLGEAVVAAILCVIVPLTGFFVQGGELDRGVLLALLPMVSTQYARMTIMNVPDTESDAAAGKKTLVVRLGVASSIRLHAVLQYGTYASLPLLWGLGMEGSIALAVLLTAPVAILQLRRLRAGAWQRPAEFEHLAFGSTLHVVAVGAATLVGFLF